MQLRRKPFGEWILIYYDKSKISEEALLSFAKKRGCKRASLIKGKKIQSSNISAQALNPYLCKGDTAVIELSSNGLEKLRLELPEGWSGSVPETISGTETVFIRTPSNVKQGEYKIHFKNGSEQQSVIFNIVEKIK